MTGAADETRTRNTLVGNQMLYQLNYCCIVYPKLTNLRYIILKLFSLNIGALVNLSRWIKKTLMVAEDGNAPTFSEK